MRSLSQSHRRRNDDPKGENKFFQLLQEQSETLIEFRRIDKHRRKENSSHIRTPGLVRMEREHCFHKSRKTLSHRQIVQHIDEKEGKVKRVRVRRFWTFRKIQKTSHVAIHRKRSIRTTENIRRQSFLPVKKNNPRFSNVFGRNRKSTHMQR